MPAAQVDFLASKALSAEELAAQRERLQALTKATRVVELDLDGERVSVRPLLGFGVIQRNDQGLGIRLADQGHARRGAGPGRRARLRAPL